MNQVTTALGTPNIALVKYWGRRDDYLNLPTNSSISITLDETVNTKTSVIFSERLKRDCLFINGKEQDLNDRSDEKAFYTHNIIEEMRRRAGTAARALIVSRNSFPTGAGLASSASGAATLVFAASKALELDLTPEEASVITRKISGSACRSLFGGFSLWKKGVRPDGSDSYAEQIVGNGHWPELADIVTLISEHKKKVSTSEGHKRTVSTSELFRFRPEVAEEHVGRLIEAIERRDFGVLAQITMEDSNNMHAVMMDSYPPIVYINDLSREVISVVHELNQDAGEPIAAYTYDAGPNAHVITLEKHKERVREALMGVLPKEKLLEVKQGSGPRLLDEGDSLIDVKTPSFGDADVSKYVNSQIT